MTALIGASRRRPRASAASRILGDLRLAARKGDRSALALALDQMRTLAHSPALLGEATWPPARNPLARLVDLLVDQAGRAHRAPEGMEAATARAGAAETKARRGGKKPPRRGDARARGSPTAQPSLFE